MKITNVQINNWEPPGQQWWDAVRGNPKESLIHATLTMEISWNEYAELLRKDGIVEVCGASDNTDPEKDFHSTKK